VAGFVLVAFAVLQIALPSAPSAVRFLIYVGLFNLLPGIVIAGLLLARTLSPGIFLIYALGFGTTANVLVFLPLWMAGVPNWFRAFPVVALCALVLMRRQLRLSELFTDWVPARSLAAWLAGATLLCGTPLLSLAYVLAEDPDRWHSFHFAFQ